MSLEDFIEYFRSFTIAYADASFKTRVVPGDLHLGGKITTEQQPSDGWAVLHMRLKTNSP